MLLFQQALSFEAYILNIPGTPPKKFKLGKAALSRGIILILRRIIDLPKSMYKTIPFAPLKDVEPV